MKLPPISGYKIFEMNSSKQKEVTNMKQATKKQTTFKDISEKDYQSLLGSVDNIIELAQDLRKLMVKAHDSQNNNNAPATQSISAELENYVAKLNAGLAGKKFF